MAEGLTLLVLGVVCWYIGALLKESGAFSSQATVVAVFCRRRLVGECAMWEAASSDDQIFVQSDTRVV